MNPRPPLLLHQIVSAAILRSFFISFLLSHGGAAAEEDLMESCIRNSNSCRRLRNISYPFWVNYLCQNQGFELTNCDDPESEPLIRISGERFRVVQTYQSAHTVTLSADEFYENACPENLINVTLRHRFLSYSRTNRNLTLFYNCGGAAGGVPEENRFRCGGDEEVIYANDSALVEYGAELAGCGRIVQVQVNGSVYGRLESKTLELDEALKLGFDADYDFRGIFCSQCEQAFGGQCIANDSSGSPPLLSCLPKGSHSHRKKLAIGISCGFGGIIIASIVFYFIYRYKRLSARPALLSRNISSDPSSMNDSEKGASFPGVHLFTYSELEQATNHFDSTRELGDGGFGTVYYGKLLDGRAVAVKRLYENNYKRVEQFMNEVQILTRLHHKNLVQLYGCTSRHSRELLLVYEFIQNGTVADHLHGQHAKPGGLPWPVRIKIAIETASALAYLHASDIIHRDVKTHNILLHDSFIVKVADFGLSRLFPMHVTHVSTAPQGTPGYVDPEYHQCYQLTDKSDVFSFGVVLIELISSMPAVDITRHRHEINLSNMAINKIQNCSLHELVDPHLGFESDYKVRKMITAVAELAFQCLQYEKDMRPSMMEVLEALMRIENQDYNKQKADEMDVSVEEVVLLKNGHPPLSPVSVTVNWNSSYGSTASTTSS